MSRRGDGSEAAQRRYYAATAASYDSAHGGGTDGGIGNEWVLAVGSLLSAYGVRSVLDVGCATGIRTTEIAARGFQVVGLDPVGELLAHGYGRHQMISGGLVLAQGSAYALPFSDKAFDGVIEMGALHHVRYPERAVQEMIRVAQRAIVIADANRFGQGRTLIRRAKLIACRAGVWPYIEWVRTKGNLSHTSEGDGVFYSYSLFDSMPQLSAWASRVFLLSFYPPDSRTLMHPLLTSPSAIIVAIR
jgi:ubiquinone/menaquinone biosynthesis C-methylase UbiE